MTVAPLYPALGSLILASGPRCILQIRQRRGGRAVSSLMVLKDNSSSSPTESPRTRRGAWAGGG